MLDGILHCLNNLNLSICFSQSRSPVTCKIKLYITTANNSFQSLPIFCYKELHLKCCLGLELNNVKQSTKTLKHIDGTPHYWVKPWEIMRNSLSYMPKNTFPFHYICGIVINFCVVYLVKAYSHLISSKTKFHEN